MVLQICQIKTHSRMNNYLDVLKNHIEATESYKKKTLFIWNPMIFFHMAFFTELFIFFLIIF